MTLADFLKLYDFVRDKKLIIYVFGNDNPHYAGTYTSLECVKKDFCTILYTVLDVSPVNENTLKIFITR